VVQGQAMPQAGGMTPEMHPRAGARQQKSVMKQYFIFLLM
jgi:hypothetical protein